MTLLRPIKNFWDLTFIVSFRRVSECVIIRAASKLVLVSVRVCLCVYLCACIERVGDIALKSICKMRKQRDINSSVRFTFILLWNFKSSYFRMKSSLSGVSKHSEPRG